MKNDLETYRSIFSTINTSGSGKVTAQELQHALGTLGIQLEVQTVRLMIKLVDRDQDQELNLGEFVHFMYICDNGVAGDYKSILFLASDDTYSMTIDKRRFQVVMQKLGLTMDDVQVQEVFRQSADLGREMSYDRFL